jgi:hypothetical protein
MLAAKPEMILLARQWNGRVFNHSNQSVAAEQEARLFAL